MEATLNKAEPLYCDTLIKPISLEHTAECPDAQSLLILKYGHPLDYIWGQSFNQAA
jgi:hypothetical protein